MPRRLAQLLSTVFAVLVLDGSSVAAVGEYDPLFQVDAVGDEYPALVLALDNLERNGLAGRITIAAPPGFELYPARPAGSIVGNGIIYATDDSYDSSAVSVLRGQIVAADLDAAGTAAAQACASAEPVAAWTLRLSLLGQPLEVPIYLSQQGGVTKLDLCVPPVARPAPLLPVISLQLSLPQLGPPRAAGAYLWHALVTPVAPDRKTLQPDKAYELRAMVPVPHSLTLRGSYDARHRRAVLHGRLTAAGKPRAGVRVLFMAFVRRVTPSGVHYDDSFAGSARTSASGTFRFRKRITRTTGFYAYVRGAASECASGPTAPGGCVSMTTAGTNGDPITISVRRP